MLWYLEGGWGWLYVHYLTFTLEQSLVSCGSNELITPVLGENVPGNLAYDPIKRIKYDLALIVIYGTLSTESHFQFDEKIQYGNFRMKPTWQVSRTSLTQNLLSLEWKQFSIIEKNEYFPKRSEKGLLGNPCVLFDFVLDMVKWEDYGCILDSLRSYSQAIS
jgi:hypothetical protein